MIFSLCASFSLSFLIPFFSHTPPLVVLYPFHLWTLTMSITPLNFSLFNKCVLLIFHNYLFFFFSPSFRPSLPFTVPLPLIIMAPYNFYLPPCSPPAILFTPPSSFSSSSPLFQIISSHSLFTAFYFPFSLTSFPLPPPAQFPSFLAFRSSFPFHPLSPQPIHSTSFVAFFHYRFLPFPFPSQPFPSPLLHLPSPHSPSSPFITSFLIYLPSPPKHITQLR